MKRYAYVLLLAVLLAACNAKGTPLSETPPAETESAPAPETASIPTGGTTPLSVAVFQPLPIELLDAQHVTEFESALKTIREAIPQTTHVGLFFDGLTTDREDWLAILDAVQRQGLKAQVAFVDSADRNAAMFRPVLENGGWELGPLGSFFACSACAGHPALYGVMVVDEPWHHEKRPFYRTEDLTSLYAALKDLAPVGTDPQIILQFSRELWRQIIDSPNNQGLAWEPGMADVVQISALEFQNGRVQSDLLDKNQYWSRKVIHAATPGIPLWSSVQVFGAHEGYWFPQPDDLRLLLDDLVASRYQAEHTLTGIAFQKWDSDTVEARSRQFTLGDAFLPGQPVEQVQAAQEAMRGIQEWFGDPAPETGTLPPVRQEATTAPPVDEAGSGVLIPLDAGTGTYKGLPLGLQDNGAPTVVPVDGLIGVVCIGMSNANQECGDFIEKWESGAFDGEINPQVRFVNCAVGGNAIEAWNDPQSDRKLWDACIGQKIPAAGLQPGQIRVIWHKAADMYTMDENRVVYPPYPDPRSDYFRFYDNLTAFAMRVSEEFPSVQAVYVSSRSYGGYASKPSRGEPLSYEEGLALDQWLKDHPVVNNVWYGWGPYLWAPDCSTGVTNASGVCYERSDYQNDGIHPAQGARDKISQMLHERFLQFDWYQPQ